MNPKATKHIYRSPCRLEIRFADGEQKLFDLKLYLAYPVYEKLKDESYCAKATVQNGVVVWDEETDFDPDRLYLEGKPLADAATIG